MAININAMLEKSFILKALQKGELDLQGQFLNGSNYTFLAKLNFESVKMVTVYKPVGGEQPLWDFPAGSLAKREVAAYQVSELLGWELVPPTIFRRKAPLGAGSLQYYIDHNPEDHYFNFSDHDKQRLRPIVVFDLIINNADRKGSHILKDPNGHLWLIDHGVCFHVEDKLRTVIWDFMGEPIPGDLCEDIRQMRQKLGRASVESDGILAQLQEYISPAELRALAKRADDLITTGYFPEPDPYRRPFPWPQI
jgi:uncharacterized repeat protein (TIGR03843 family)